MSTKTEEKSTTDEVTEAEVAERICPKCGQGDLPPKYRVHDECLSTPTAQRRRERVRKAGHEMVRANQRDKFDRQLGTVTDVQLDVWEDRAADAKNSSGEDEAWNEAGAGKRREMTAEFVASIIVETVDDPGKKKAAATSA